MYPARVFTVWPEFPKALASRANTLERRDVLSTCSREDVFFSGVLARSLLRRRSSSQRRLIRRSRGIFVRVAWIPFENVRPGTAGLFEQYPAERAAKVLVEDGVDERVQRGVHVAEPERDDERLRGYFDAREQWFRDVEDEERQPAGDEAAHDETEYQRGSFLLLSRQSPLLSLRVPWFRRFRLDAGLVLGRTPSVPVLSSELTEILTAEDRLAESDLQRLHHRTPGYNATVRRRRVEL